MATARQFASFPMMWLRRACLALAIMMLAACTSLPPSAPLPEGGTFARQGRFAITAYESDGQHQAIQGGFSWSDNEQHYQLDLSNPLGSTEARVEGEAGKAILTRADGSQLAAQSPDELVEQAMGSRLPVSGLRDWLRGRLSADTPATAVVRDTQGRPTAFKQGGWQAQLSRYDAQGPQLLALERQESDRRIVVRLVINPR